MPASGSPVPSGGSTPSLALDDPVAAVEGIGTRTAAQLRTQLGIETVRDLVEHYPRRYDDLGALQPLDAARVGEAVTLVGQVVSWHHFRPGARRRSGGRTPPRAPRKRSLEISEATVVDRGSGQRFTVTFFNQRWREQQLREGSVAAFSGTLERRNRAYRIAMPQFQHLGQGDEELEHRRLLPVYPATERVPSWRLAGWIGTVLDELPPFEDFLSEDLRARHDLEDRDTAVRAIHLPEDREQRDRARRRLVFDELFTLQVGLQWRRVRLEADVVGLDNGPIEGQLAARFLTGLPFRPTGAQARAMDEIGADLAAERPMHRLLQGDVGSGKTLVAIWSMLCAVDRGRQAALMAPTEVLAEQHHRTLSEQLAPLGVNVLDGVRVELLTSGTTATSRRRILGELLEGRVDLVVGTHALLQEGVRFADLGVVVIDEQHRFGVHQRVQLRAKGETGRHASRPTRSAAAPPPDPGSSSPDVLVMTATPIPRSLALTIFGDLEVTVLDELPPGRQEIITQLITPDQEGRRDRLYDFVREQARRGQQTYVVCPLVEESEEVAARAAEAEHARLRDEVFPDLRVGLVHGRLRSDAKDAAMGAFRRGELDVLVATTVIEVGVDVPSASVMIIEDADRFGISQLHQLRGRVGRGADQSYCVLFAGWSGEGLTEDARTRLAAVERTSDGFELAETDLELRGIGQLFGVRQSGLPDLKLTRLPGDQQLAGTTSRAARELVAADPELADPRVAALREEVRRRYRGGLEELEALATG